MEFQTGWFAVPEKHHEGWFKVFRFNSIIEVWFGHRWYAIKWR